MRLLLVLMLSLCFAACNSEESNGDAGREAAVADASDGGLDPGCGVVFFCLGFLPDDSFAECVLPFPPGYDTVAGNAFYQCVNAAANGGSCTADCTPPDAAIATVSATCANCLYGTCSASSCAGGVCSAEATACKSGE